MSISLTPLEDKIIVKQARPRPRPRRVCSFRTTPRRSRSRAKSWPSARAAATTRASASRWTSRVGDKVLYSKYGGTEVHYEGEDYLIVSSRDLLAIIG